MITTQAQTRPLNIFLVMLSSLQLFSCFVFLLLFLFCLVESNKTLAPAYVASFENFIVTNSFI